MEGQSQGTSKRFSLCLGRGRVVPLVFFLFSVFVVSCVSAQAPLTVDQNISSPAQVPLTVDQNPPSLPWKDDVVPEEVVVGFLPGVSDENVKSVALQLGAEVGGKNFPDGNYYLFKFKTNEAANLAVKVLNQDKTKYQIHTAFHNRRMRILPQLPSPPQKEGKVPLLLLAYGLISVDVENAPLRAMLGEVSRLSGVSITYTGSEGVDPKVSARFQDLLLEEGLKKLLGDSDFILFYEPSSHRLVRAIVRFKDNSFLEHATPLATQAVAPDATGENPEVRFMKLQAFARREKTVQDPEALPLLTEAAFDPEANLRIAAVEALVRMHDSHAADVLTQAASHENVKVRMTAIEALGSLKEEWAIRLLQQAANFDAKEVVQERAKELLENLRQ